MGHIKQFRNAKLSLWQAAVNEVIGKTHTGTRTLAIGAPVTLPQRPDTDDSMMASVTAFCHAAASTGQFVAPAGAPATLGIADVALYCSNVALKLAEALGRAMLAGDQTEVDRARAQLGKFGDCDPRYAEAAEKYAEYFVLQHKAIPYRRHSALDDFVIDDVLPAQATVAILGDWGTGQDVAWQVLRSIAAKKPDVVIHLGDIYYAATEFEVQSYFLTPWQQILGSVGPHESPRTFSLAGNHDMYAGGAAYYTLLDRLGQPASYFCLRNASWQFVAMDTGLHDSNPVGGEPTMLEDSEVQWVMHKMQTAGPRKTIFLSHHQLYTAYEDIGGKAVNEHLRQQLQGALPSVAAWFWGHEHDLVVYEKYCDVLGRCAGHGAFPIGIDELPQTPKFADVQVKNIRLTKGFAFYRHGYILMNLDGAAARVRYFQDTDPETVVYEEIL